MLETEPIEIPMNLARELLPLPTGATHCEARRLASGETEFFVWCGGEWWDYVGSIWEDMTWLVN